MKQKDDTARLIRFLENDLPETEMQSIRQRLEHEQELRTRLQGVVQTRAAFAAARPTGFEPWFSERVLRELQSRKSATAADSLYSSLRWIFVRTAIACLLLAVTLGAFNIIGFESMGSTTSLVDALFGLPSASLADALSYGAL